MSVTPGRVLARVTVLPAIAAAAWLLVAFPLLVVGHLSPVTGLVLGGAVVLAAVAVVPRWVPDLDEDGVGWWPVVAVGLITVAFAAVQVAYHAEALVIRRDPASYAQFTVWIAERGSLPIPQQRELIAGDHPALGFGSLAYYEVGDVIWPQFLSGAPLVYSVGYWVGDLPGMLVAAPLVGALGVLSFAGLVARLVGSRWAPLAALLLATCLPQQWVSRSTYSEPLAQVLLLGALALTYDALSRAASPRERWDRGRLLAGAAGVVFGLALVVRVDVLRDLLPLVAFAGLLLLARCGRAVPLLAGLAVGVGYGAVAWFGLSRPYLDHLSDSLVPLLWLSAGVVLLTAVATVVLWRRGFPGTGPPRWLPAAGAGLVVTVAAGLAARPLFLTQQGHGDEATGRYVEQVQSAEGLPIAPERTYEEMSLLWVAWYVGPVVVVVAALAAAIVAHRLLRGWDPRWVLPATLLMWSVALTLARPAITPDHPWASRRLVVLVLPAFILFAVWFLAWLAPRLRRRAYPPVVRAAGAAAVATLAATMLVPTAVTASGIMSYRSDIGTVGATRELCAALPDDASVLIVDPAVASNYMQLIRGVCQVPTAAVDPSDRLTVEHVADEVRDRGRTPVLAAAVPRDLSRLVSIETPVAHPFRVRADQDPSTLMEPPRGAWPFAGDVWIAVPRRS
ncbi:hypothetical protein [Halostreptopolyspora alba]|uniref:Glycosyltransferase RgtA/B/C/D-like domain-containing protein n=1 Tax=Halostreptopolyspora alba TaxID=2487137 RepID=A0A3N0E3G8_9ACTN|nr:hypothetical protein EFW17_19750 [Nocardiopsaceae bacterium YIM 96095]